MNENLSTLKGFILNSAIAPRNKFKLPKCLMLALEHLRKNKDIVITKADKGNKVVVLNAVDYEQKLNELISDNSTYEICNNNPLKIWQQSYNRNLKTILKDLPNLFKKYQPFVPSPPYLYGLPKIHKDIVPLRPIVSTTGSVTYKLSKYIAAILKELNGSISDSYISNTGDFLNKVRNVDLHNKTMVSFDVSSLFTTVPLDDTMEF